MNILAIPVQSISDLITNSSSEVFILDAGKTVLTDEDKRKLKIKHNIR